MAMSLTGEGVTRMPDLSVEVREHEIIVTSQRLKVRYRKLGKSPMLVSDDPMPNKPNSDELNFRVRAWNAAFAKAKELCWI
jgi:hypothetical protein